jgi:hypothetical protein
MSDNNCPNIDNIINSWYSQMNIPLNNFSNIKNNLDEYKNKAPIKWSIIWIINKFYKIIDTTNNEISMDIKYQFYNMYNCIKLFNPVFFIILIFLLLTECKPIYKLSESSIIDNIPTSITYMYIFLFIIVISIIIYTFYKKINCYANIIKDIKEKKFKSFYILVLLIVLALIFIINIFLPTVISPIINSITSLSTDEQSNYTKIIVILLFLILIFIFTMVFNKIYKNKRLKEKNNDADFFSVLNGISFNIYLIFSLLLITVIITYIFGGMGDFILTMLLGFIYSLYIIIIYVILYTILEGGNYNKILVFTVILLIIISIAGLYMLYQTVESINTLCTTNTTSTSLSIFTIFSNIFLPILLLFLTIYLYGYIYTDQNWTTNKSKFYMFYTIYAIIIITSWFTNNISISTIYTIMFIIITIIQRRWVLNLCKDTFTNIKKFGKGISHIKNDAKQIIEKKLT